MKLYISDLDGTLLNSHARISDNSRDIINKLIENNDLNFSIATARTPATVVPILKELNIKLPLVVMNGAATYSLKEEKYTKFNSIPTDICNEISNLLKSSNSSFFTYTLDGNHINVYFDCELNKTQKKFMNLRKGSNLKSFIKGEVPQDTNTLYFLIMDTEEVVMKLKKELELLTGIISYAYRDIYFKEYFILEIFSEKSSKANSINELMEEFKFNELTVFGDNINDIPMFEIANNKVAVNNAIEELKNISTSIAEENNLDGVAKYILNDLEKNNKQK